MKDGEVVDITTHKGKVFVTIRFDTSELWSNGIAVTYDRIFSGNVSDVGLEKESE